MLRNVAKTFDEIGDWDACHIRLRLGRGAVSACVSHMVITDENLPQIGGQGPQFGAAGRRF